MVVAAVAAVAVAAVAVVAVAVGCCCDLILRLLRLLRLGPLRSDSECCGVVVIKVQVLSDLRIIKVMGKKTKKKTKVRFTKRGAGRKTKVFRLVSCLNTGWNLVLFRS